MPHSKRSWIRKTTFSSRTLMHLSTSSEVTDPKGCRLQKRFMNHHIDSSNTSCTIVDSPSGDNSDISHFIDSNLVVKNTNSEASHSAEMVTKSYAPHRASDDSEYDENEISTAKRGRSTPRGNPITLENVNRDKTKRSASVAGREKTRAMMKKPAYDFEDQESSQEEEEATERVQNGKEVKNNQASNATEIEGNAKKRHKKNDSKDDNHSFRSGSSALSLKCALPIGPIKGRGTKKSSDYDNLRKHLPNNVRKGVDQILKSVQAQTLNVEGLEFNEMEVEIRMEEEEEVEEGEVDQSEKGEGETTEPAGIDETVQREIVENTERQRSNNSPSSSSEAIRVETNAPAKRSQQTVLQKLLSDALKDFGRELFESEFKEQIKKSKPEELLRDLMEREVQKYIGDNASGLLRECIASNLNSFIDPSDERVDE